MKPTSFNYGDYLQLQAENEHLQFRVKQTEYSATEMLNIACEIVAENDKLRTENISLRTERDRARLDCAVAERNHMNTLERLLEAQERIDELQSENKALRNELCYKCGRYKEAHNGACNECRWKDNV